MEYYFNQSHMMNLGELAGSMWDRNRIIFKDSPIKLLMPVGELNSVSFAEACEDRAKELASLNKKIYVLWSGGLDSTTVFLCLREVLPKENLAVLYTKASLEEYPNFFESNILDIYESHEFDMDTMWIAVEKYSQQGILVTGEIGDQLFGSSWIDKEAPTNTNWKSFKNGMLLKIQNFEEFVESCPHKLKNLSEVFWWMNYSLKYQYVQVRMLLDNKTTILNENIYHFFDTKMFNDYAVSTPLVEKMPNFDKKNYKYPMRLVIEKLSKDKDYAYNKPKVRSWITKFKYTKLANAIDTNWNRYY